MVKWMNQDHIRNDGNAQVPQVLCPDCGLEHVPSKAAKLCRCCEVATRQSKGRCCDDDETERHGERLVEEEERQERRVRNRLIYSSFLDLTMNNNSPR